MKEKRRIALILAVVLWALLLAPFFLGAPAAHPATDDFTFAAYTRKTWLATRSFPHVAKDAFSYALRTWRDWQGTVTGVILMALNPAVFSLEHYGLHALALLALDLAAAGIFLRHMLRRCGLGKRLRAVWILALTAIQLVFLPDIVEGIYWFNGAWFYTGANAAALLALTGADVLAEKSGRRRMWAAVPLAAVFFALGMDNFITAMMTAAALFVMAAQRLWARKKRAAGRTAAFLLFLGAGLALSVAAPGNSVRMATDGAHQSGLLWLLSSILWTMRDALKYILRFSLRTPLLAVMLLSTPALLRALPEGKAERIPPIGATLAGFYAVLCAMIIPHMYSSGYAGSGRVVNMYHDYVVLTLPVCWCMILRRLPPEARSRLSGKRILWRGAAAAACIICLLSGQQNNYLKLVRDQMDGTQAAYIRQFRNEYALCGAAGPEDDVLLPAWTVQTVTGKPTAYPDPEIWTNVAMADYFGVKSVRAESPE